MRRLLPEEVEELAEVEAELFPHNCFNENTLKRELQVSKCWVVCDEKRIVGYAIIRTEGQIVDILRLGVREPYCRQGIASRLLTRARQERPKAMLTVKKDNLTAIRLYKSFGFQIVSHIEHENAWIMATSDD